MPAGSPIPKLLISVRSAHEATAALAGGADWIDVKDPRHGALGMASKFAVQAVVEAVAARRPVSMAAGELRDWADTRQVASRIPAGVGSVKLGLSGCHSAPDWFARLAEVSRHLPKGVRLVAVAYADWRGAGAPSPREVLEAAQRLSCAALLIDTWDKQAGGLFDHLPPAELTALSAQARQLGLLAVAAGSLRASDFDSAIAAGADMLAVRGAACEGQCRTAQVSELRVAQLCDGIQRAASATESHTLFARGR